MGRFFTKRDGNYRVEVLELIVDEHTQCETLLVIAETQSMSQATRIVDALTEVES